MFNKSSILVAAALLVSGLGNVAEAGKGRDNPDLVEDALAFALTDRSKSLMLLEGAINDDQSPEESSVLYLFAGEQRRLNGDVEMAHKWFAKVLELSTSDLDVAAARLGLALLELQKNPNTKSLGILRSISENGILDTQNADRFLVLAIDVGVKNKKLYGQYTKKSLAYAKSDPAVLERVQRVLEPSAEPVVATASPEPAKVSANPPPVQVLPTSTASPLERAEAALAAGEVELAVELANQVLTSSEDEDEQLVANYLVKRSAVQIDPKKIAIILPFTDKYEAVGAQFREALEFGYGATPTADLSLQVGTDNTPTAPQRELIYIDSGATEESVIAAIEAAALEHGVIAAVGPLLSEQTDAAVRVANALRLPLISLSQSLDDTTDLDWVFQAMVNTSVQVEALLEHVHGKLGMRSFAIFAPDNPYGHRAATVFTAGVENREGEVTITHFYDPSATDLIPFAKEFGRKDYEERAREFRELRELAEEKGRDPKKVVLPPTIDFEAIFIPDNVSRIPLACAALAYEEFPMGEFQTTKEGPVIPLLGLSGWNHPAMVNRGGPYARGGYFTDVYEVPTTVIDPDNPLPPPEPIEPPADPTEEVAVLTQEERVEQFAKAYKERTGRSPKPLEVVTVDAGRLLAAAAASEGNTRAEFRQALLDIALNDGLTGATSFDPETRVALRKLEILTITKDGIVPAPLVEATATDSP
jgi:ABC-type branched-subunit amino acid transport system substrate-binding protein